ncbi:MAG: hypothetical protein IT514_03335 [Burkholderiales bacterium]|nr:hypothetical protein [Burkholderiales bacterium]
MKLAETILTGLLRTPLLGGWCEAALAAGQRAAAGAMRRARRQTVRPREWSNAQLRRIGAMYEGAVVNVSGWRDEDKLGGQYRDYFPRASRYAVSNFSGARGSADGAKGLFIDLEGEIPADLRGAFQVAFNHTTLEHVYDIRRAVANLCALSSDSVVLVTPFLQAVHCEEGAFGDYWRPTPQCLSRMLADCGFTTVYQNCNDNPWYIVYLFTVAAREPEKYSGRLPPWSEPRAGERHFGFR